MFVFDVFQEDDESSASEIIVGKSMLENAIEAAACHPLPCWGKGGRSELTRRADKRGGVSRTVCASKNAAFFSSGMDLEPAPHIQLAKVGYHAIAQAGSY